MHEMSLVLALMENICDVARQNHLKKVSQVHVEAGVLRQVVPELMQEAFRAASYGTVAEGAHLKITAIEPLAQCRICHNTFRPAFNDFICPKCLKADVHIRQGNEIILKAVEGDA